VVDAIRMLHRQGYMLHTTSGESSLDLAGYLQAMGVSDCFGRLYGPDLIDTFKEGPEYYERMLADLGISPADALVVDDSPRAIQWATQVGARAVLVGDSSLPQGERPCILGVSSSCLPCFNSWTDAIPWAVCVDHLKQGGRVKAALG
jgi:beta-phosphoglucomutase-like phosphatase (HAD superfamily)